MMRNRIHLNAKKAFDYLINLLNKTFSKTTPPLNKLKTLARLTQFLELSLSKHMS